MVNLTMFLFSSSSKFASIRNVPFLWKPFSHKFINSTIQRNLSTLVKPQLKNSLPRVVPIIKTLQGSTRHYFESISDNGRRAVGYWLLGMAGMCFGAVVLGGVTRLTESGLSMTSWHPVSEFPPLTNGAWEEEFERYKAFPEYRHILSNRGEMTLNEFKFIFFMEYFHRMWGRAIGVAFVLPAIWFAYKGHFTSGMKKRVFIMGSLIGFQGLLGWFMVQSGLEDRGKQDIPRVSQYRLAAHLGSAFVLYSLFLWNGLSHLIQPMTFIDFPRLNRIRSSTHGVMSLVFFTALSGAFVAGLDAGLTYNTWPKMADRWIPSDLYALPDKWRNHFENPTTVQFNHRHLAEFTGACVVYMWFLINRRSSAALLDPRIRKLSHFALGMVLVQITLGVTTLLNHVPVWLAACHQSGSLVLLSSLLALSHALRKLPK